jgi:hypothetical protein
LTTTGRPRIYANRRIREVHSEHCRCDFIDHRILAQVVDIIDLSSTIRIRITENDHYIARMTPGNNMNGLQTDKLKIRDIDM